MRCSIVPFVLVSSIVTGCGKTHEQLVMESRETAKAQLERVEAIAEDAKSLPPLEEDTVAYDGEPLALPDSSGKTISNAGLLFLPTYEKRDEETVDYRNTIFDNQWWRWTSSALQNPPTSSEDVMVFQMEQQFKQLAATRYVLVLKPTLYIAPRHERTEGETVHYQRGHFSGEVHLFELSSGKHFGGATIESADGALPLPLTVTTKKEQVERDLHSYMLIRLEENALKKLRKLLPGKIAEEQ